MMLRDYQNTGVDFLLTRQGAILADEMGLGKSAQICVALSKLNESEFTRSLIVVPASLRSNWRVELSLWAPELRVLDISGAKKDRPILYRLPAHVLITTYEQLVADYLSILNERYACVVLDEAQRIKNPNTKTALAARSVKRNMSWAITGTPIENNISDLESILAFVDRDRVLADRSTDTVNEVLEDTLIRRRKEEVVKELPEIIRQEIAVDMTPEQQSVYDEFANSEKSKVRGAPEGSKAATLLASITKLKQICNGTGIDGTSGKEQVLDDIVENAAANEKKVVVVSQFVQTLSRLHERYDGSIALYDYNGKMNTDARNDSLSSFKNYSGAGVLLLSLKAGGVGLNINEADMLVMYDRWWNPAVEEQAIARAHRLNRLTPLHLIVLMMKSSVEDKIVEILHTKRKIAASVLADPDPALAPKLDRSDLSRILFSQ